MDREVRNGVQRTQVGLLALRLGRVIGAWNDVGGKEPDAVDLVVGQSA
jgi:hypothetical protein